MRNAAAILVIAGVVVVVWGVGLIVKAATGGTPDSPTATIVVLAVLAVAAGLILLLVGARLLRRQRSV